VCERSVWSLGIRTCDLPPVSSALPGASSTAATPDSGPRRPDSAPDGRHLRRRVGAHFRPTRRRTALAARRRDAPV